MNRKGNPAIRGVTMILAMLFAASLLVFPSSSPGENKDEMTVVRDKDKTVYTIGSSGNNRKEEEKDREKSWEMLKNMNIIIDKRHPGPPPAK